MQVLINIPDEEYKKISNSNPSYADDFSIYYAIKNGTPIPKQEPTDVLQEIRKRIADLYNTDVIYDNGDYNTMDSPTLDKVLEYFDSEVLE